jgi:IS5 family transposase
VWKELQSQLEEKGLKIKKGHIQDATFIESDLGKKRHSKEKKARKEGKQIRHTKRQLNHIDVDSSFSVKSGRCITGTN